MTVDKASVSRACRDGGRHIDRMKDDLRQLSNDFERLGQTFRNEKAFTSDASRLRDEVRQVERDIEKLKDRVRSIERSNR